MNPSNGGWNSQRVIHHGATPATKPGAMTRNSNEPRMAEVRRISWRQFTELLDGSVEGAGEIENLFRHDRKQRYHVFLDLISSKGLAYLSQAPADSACNTCALSTLTADDHN